MIDAAATLDPADRALLNLWVNRGLDDERLTVMTGMPTATLEARRGRIVTRLATELGLPENDVRAALVEISPPTAALTPPPSNGAVAASNGAGPEAQAAEEPVAEAAPAAQAAAEPAAEAEAEAVSQSAVPADSGPSTGESTPRRRRGVWLALAALLVLAVVIVVILVNGGSSTPRRAKPTTTASATAAPTTTAATTTAPATTASVSTPAPAHPAPGPVPEPLAGLPGGLARASGTLQLQGPVKHLKLTLTVKGLPAPHNGHYEVWLYNSVLDSDPLGRLHVGHDTLTAQLPPDARRFSWIDVSFQPLGDVFHSGESELRAANPAHTTKARLHQPATRTRRKLRQATKVTITHTARHRGARRGSP